MPSLVSIGFHSSAPPKEVWSRTTLRLTGTSKDREIREKRKEKERDRGIDRVVHPVL